MAGDARHGTDPEYMAKLKKELGMDKPLHIRYLLYIKNLMTGDLGVSYLHRQKVSQLIGGRLWPTLKLALVTMVFALMIGIPLGFFSALHQGTWLDTISMVGAVSGVSIPRFWLGLLLMYLLSVKFRLLPTTGYGNGELKYLILPAAALGVSYIALLARTTRAAVVEIFSADYIRTARAKGLSEPEVSRKHVLRNTFILILTTAGLQFGTLMSHTVVVEKLFSWPGIGSLVVDSIFQRDIPVTQGCILFIIFIFLLVNLSVDILYSFIDPRIVHK
jgi:peptide/nickel transport system permease protein